MNSSAKRARRARRLLIATAISALVGVGTGAGTAAAATSPSSSRAVVAAKVRPSVVDIRVGPAGRARSGRGLVVRADGYVLISADLLTGTGAGADSPISVQTADGDFLAARLVGIEPITELAVLKVSGGRAWTAATFASTNELDPGQAAAGYADGVALFGPDGAVLAVYPHSSSGGGLPADEAVRVAVELIAAGSRCA